MCPSVSPKMGRMLTNLINFDLNLAEASPTTKHLDDLRTEA